MAKKRRNNNRKGKKTKNNAASKAAMSSATLPTPDIVESNECNENPDTQIESGEGMQAKPVMWNGEMISPNMEALYVQFKKELKIIEGEKAKGIVAAERAEGEEKKLCQWMKQELLEAVMKDEAHMVKIGIITPRLTDEEKQERELRDEVLFKEHPTPDDCEICALPLPIMMSEKVYQVCCGKIICVGCTDAMRETNRESRGDLCPFCREINTSSNMLERVEKRVALNDPSAMSVLADMHFNGSGGMPKDIGKAFKLMSKAGELGLAEALHNLGSFYDYGEYVEKDVPKCKHFWELAAMKGSIESRHYLACLEERTKTPETIARGVKHFLIAARAGYEPSMKAVTNAFQAGCVTKKEYEEVLRAYQVRVDEMKSEQRNRTREFNAPIDDEALFKDHPARENCPVCCLTLPFGTGATYNICCGTNVCGGCILAQELNGRGESCITCGAIAASDFDVVMKRIKKRMDLNDAAAFNILGSMHSSGNLGARLDQKKAIELWTRAGELGSGKGLGNLGLSYANGEGVKRNITKAKYYYEQAAIKGHEVARHNLGCIEDAEGNHDRAVKHFVIAAKAGVTNSMKLLSEKYMKGDSCISKDLFEKTLRAHHDAATEMRSKQRDKAASYLAQGLGTSVRVDKKGPKMNPGNKTKQAKGKTAKA